MKIIAIIGGGSTYTPLFVEHILKKWEELRVDEIRLYDISEVNLRNTSSFLRRLIEKSGKSLDLVLSPTPESAVDCAEFVMTQIRVGGLQARKKDILLGLEFDLIGQETTGVGGFAKALRTVPEILKIAMLMEKYAAADSWLINFTNPAGIVTEAVLRNTDINAVGICNCSLNMIADIAALMKVSPDTLDYDYAGANHLAGIVRIQEDGKNVLGYAMDLLAESESGNMKNTPDFELPAALMKRVGFIPVSYLKYYWFTRKTLAYLKNKTKTRADEVIEIESFVRNYYADAENTAIPEAMNSRGGAHYNEVAYRVIAALSGIRKERLSIIGRNGNSIPLFDPDTILEVPHMISNNHVEPEQIGRLPATLEGLVRQVKNYETLAVRAAITKDRDTALHAMMNNPLIGDVDRLDEIFDRLLEYNKQFLGNWD